MLTIFEQNLLMEYDSVDKLDFRGIKPTDDFLKYSPTVVYF